MTCNRVSQSWCRYLPPLIYWRCDQDHVVQNASMSTLARLLQRPQCSDWSRSSRFGVRPVGTIKPTISRAAAFAATVSNAWDSGRASYDYAVSRLEWPLPCGATDLNRPRGDIRSPDLAAPKLPVGPALRHPLEVPHQRAGMGRRRTGRLSRSAGLATVRDHDSSRANHWQAAPASAGWHPCSRRAPPARNRPRCIAWFRSTPRPSLPCRPRCRRQPAVRSQRRV